MTTTTEEPDLGPAEESDLDTVWESIASERAEIEQRRAYALSLAARIGLKDPAIILIPPTEPEPTQ